jgi:hypothetical protein
MRVATMVDAGARLSYEEAQRCFGPLVEGHILEVVRAVGPLGKIIGLRRAQLRAVAGDAAS